MIAATTQGIERHACPQISDLRRAYFGVCNSRQPITARLPTNHCPLFVQPPRKRPDKRTATDNLPEISMRSVHLSRQIGGHAPV